MKDLPVIPIAEAGDILHRGDLIFVTWDVGARGWAQRLIVDWQTNHILLDRPYCDIQHVMVITHPAGGRYSGVAQEWKGWSMQPWRGREIDIKIDPDYRQCQLRIMRYTGWRDDAQRYEYCDRVIAECHHHYSFTGCIKVALGLFPQLPGGRFCSESAEAPAEAMGLNGGIGFVKQASNRVSPGQLAASPYLTHIATVYAK